MLRYSALFLPACLALAGCSSIEPMKLPVVAPPPTPALLFADEGGRHSRASFRLERVIAAIPRGSVVAHFPFRIWEAGEASYMCNAEIDRNATAEWGFGTRYFREWSTELKEAFYVTMHRHGANVVGDTSALFENSAEVRSAEYLVGGRIIDLKGNICHRHTNFPAVPLGDYLGEFYIKVEWEVFSSLSRRVVYRFQTEGYAETRTPMQNGVEVTFLNAFAAAVERAALESGFRRILNRGTAEVANSHPDSITLTGRDVYRDAAANHIVEITDAAVTIELGSAHGSGFLVSRDGHLLTNAHVVAGGKTVPVVFRNGVRVKGTVLRAEPRRDVALVKVPVFASYILPIGQQGTLAVGDEVYVVGSPFDPSLRSTVTKGIVSAFRTIDGQPYIQADAAVTPGNSGGPLLDARGNVIGITVQKVTGAENLNLFIPIDDALKALNLAVVVD